MANILVVDDSGMMRFLIKTILEKAGHSIIAEAINADQAFLLYEKHLPDLVTMDLTMPEVNGIDAIKRIIGTFPTAKIVVVSALADKTRIIDSIRQGAKHYILKPFDENKVIEVVNKILNA